MSDTAQAPQADPRERAGQYPHGYAAGFKIAATSLDTEPVSDEPVGSWAVTMTLGDVTTGQFVRYLSPTDARAVAAALGASADFYDAETARLVALGVTP